MGFTPDFLEEIRTRIPVSDVVGRKVRLVRKGHEHTGLCPFHNEKTPSFTVNDDKGFYHCFGCSAHGDVIKFVIETEGLTFPEAVERLAGQAGLALPEYTPQDRAQTERRKNLYDVMELAAHWFESQLVSQGGRVGAEYFNRRGLTKETIKIFRLGYSPENRTALKEAMMARDGVNEDMLVEGGLLIRPEGGGESYDRFRGRVMFPITDRQGRVVAFGGRALHKDAKAKYLNSPETPLFHKGRLLYNLAGARKSAFDNGQLLVAEGYMDVIALSQAGFPHAVAPLGTAVTEDQIREMWRMVAEPVLCFDGDKAGQRAAHRVVERALGLLKPGYSLRFIHLPEGEDPDSYVNGHGAKAFQLLVDDGQPLADLLWQGLTGGGNTDTPEQRAGLEQKIAQTLGDISDKTIRGYYESDFQRRLRNFFGGEFVPDINLHNAQQKENHPHHLQAVSAKKNFSRTKEASKSIGNLKETAIGKAENFSTLDRERLIILTVLKHVWLLERYEEEFATFDFESEALDKLRNEIIRIAHNDSTLETNSLHRHLLHNGYGKALEIIFKRGVLTGSKIMEPGSSAEEIEEIWLQALHIFQLERLSKDIAELEEMDLTEEDFARLQHLLNEKNASIMKFGSLPGKRDS